MKLGRQLSYLFHLVESGHFLQIIIPYFNRYAVVVVVVVEIDTSYLPVGGSPQDMAIFQKV